MRRARHYVRRATRYVRSWGPRVFIVAYHRVGERRSDPQLLQVTQAHFVEHLEVFRRTAQVLPLGTLARRVSAGTLPRRAIAITFDDGYADNLRVAKPELERFDLPATVFITTGFLESGVYPWWDELEAILLEPGRLPPVLEVELPSRTIQEQLGTAVDYSPQDAQRYAQWNVTETTTPTSRHHLYRILHAALRDMEPDRCARAMSDLRQWAGRPVDSIVPPTMCREDVSQLVRGGLVEVGAHTIRHPRLSQLGPAEQQLELAGSKEQLEELTEAPVTVASYPYGSARDYSELTVSIARSVGFEAACTTEERACAPGQNVFGLPRVLVRDWTGDELSRHLRSWLRA